jgi:anti-sigma B factor antagonist
VRGMSDGDLMTLATTWIGSTAVVTVTGELDLHTSRDLMASVDHTFAQPGLSAVVIDLSGVSFLGSSGMGTLAALTSRAPAIPVRLVSTPHNRAVQRPWETMNLHQALPLHADVDTALADLAG